MPITFYKRKLFKILINLNYIIKNKIKFGILCLIASVFLFGGKTKAFCLPSPDLFGTIKKTETKINILACNDDIKVKQLCRPYFINFINIINKILKFLKLDKYIITGFETEISTIKDIIPPEIIEDGDTFRTHSECLRGYELFLYNKNNKLKYAYIEHTLRKPNPKNIEGITILLPKAKNKISCREDDRLEELLRCTYSAEFEINGEKIILEPGQVFQGENFTLKYLGSSFIEHKRKELGWVWSIEDDSDYFVYEVYLKSPQPKGGAGSAGVFQKGKHLLILFASAVLILGGTIFLLKFKKKKKV